MSTYTTKQGDMWDQIAANVLGSESYTGDLMRANGKHLEYYTFPAGIVLEIPTVSETDLITPAVPWKEAHD
jgi:phage tail protein X